jgi:hypothetical protein
MTGTMPLCRAFENIGLSAVASRIAVAAQLPDMLDAQPLRHVRGAEHDLRCWIRGQTEAPYLEIAIARLVLAALTLQLNPPAEVSCEEAR